MAMFLSEAQLDLRAKAKSGIIEICNHLGDWYRMLKGKVNSSAFKLICDLMTKNPQATLEDDEYPSRQRKGSEARTISVSSTKHR